ncbi:MAG: TonB-dependent receptor plug domain-containing protein [Nitrospirales bacterium]|nr:TonB-dependent receptor plug domain-containing protein [Nitrospira sp.]MDR4499971.1 TonB-dependent receptor plug domain-containing protein [Nitrospirales bacterium]
MTYPYPVFFHRAVWIPAIVFFVFFGQLWTQPAFGNDQEDITVLEEVLVVGERPVAASSNRIILNEDILLQPQGRPADLLRLAPGLITLEHSGGAGKSDQYLLRGFDADHGTDLAIHVDGMPINMRSHAHGQGYGDINFIIPETIEEIVVKKGPYHVEYGDFATAGAANYVTRDWVPHTIVQSAGGSFNTQRHLFITSPFHEKFRTLLAGEFYYTDGPYDFVNRNTRYNGLAKFTVDPSESSQLSVTLTQYYGRWNGSGQIPLREVTSGRLDRFGSLDPSEGGQSIRTTGRLDYSADLPGGGTVFARLWAQYYYLSLFTNFTFYLNDPVNSDGIEQTDHRWLTGGDIGYRQIFRFFGSEGAMTAGLQTRFDNIRVRLGTQHKRSSLAITQESDIFESSYSPYLRLDLQFFPWLRFVGGGRVDVFTYHVKDRCGAACSVRPNGFASDAITSGKANLIFGPWDQTEFFLNVGTGFHSNDARDVVENSSANTLPRAVGYEVGIKSHPWDWSEILATFWLLDLESELVFVGDEGTTERRGKTRRLGMEFSARLTPLEWLTLRADITYTHAEFRKTGDSVPLAPEFTAFSMVTARLPMGLSGTLQMLTVGSRAGTEDDSVKLEPFTIFDLILRYKIPVRPPAGRLEAFFSIRNLTDTDWRQAQFFYASRLSGEPAGGVSDIHFVPGTPRMFMGGLTWFWPE